MALETAPFLAGLDPNNPGPNDPKARGDDHVRLLKKALAESFVGFPGVVLAGGTDVGVSNTYVLTPPNNLLQYSQNMVVFWLPSATNGGASTINISGLGAVPIKRIDGTTLENGDIQAGQPVAMLYAGDSFRMVSVTAQYVASLVFNGVLPGQVGNAGKVLTTNGTTASFSNAFGVAMDEAKGANIPATSSLNLESGPGTGNYLHIIGSATVNAMVLPGGASRDLCWDGVNTLVNSGSLILPTGANIVTAPGDTCVARGEGAGIVRITDYTRKSGRALVENVTPGLYLLATITPTVAAAIDLLNVFSSTYDDYLILCEGLSSSGADNLVLRVARGGVVDASSSYGGAAVNGGSGGTVDRITLHSSPGTNGSLGVRIEVLGANASGAQAYQHVLSTGISGALGGTFTATALNGVHGNGGVAGPLSGFRLFWNTGSNFGATGAIRVYGYKKA